MDNGNFIYTRGRSGNPIHGFNTALEKATGNYSSKIPTKTNMIAQIEVNAIRLENEPPRLDSLSIITGDERNYRVSTVGKDDEAILNSQGRIFF